MFDDATNPEHLIDSLLAFIQEWYGWLPSWYGVSDEKLSATSLPEPLRRLYAAVGNMPGREGAPFVFSHHDTLLPFEWLRSDDDRLLFAVENQGVWRCYTEASGVDPPVWIVVDDGEPELAPCSLSSFLVTLCLQEITLGSQFTYAGDRLIESFSATGFRVSPLWMHGEFPLGEQWKRLAYHLVEGRALIQGDHWVGFRFSEDEFLPALSEARRISPPTVLRMTDWLADPSTPGFVKKMHYERLARQHQQQADMEQSRADECRRLADEIMRNEQE